MQTLSRAYEVRPEISKAKKDDLLELCRQNLIPPLYHEFYNSL